MALFLGPYLIKENIMSITISYLLPSFNHGLFILQTLEAIKQDLLQLSQEAELLIIDDGSTDDSVQMIKQWITAQNGQFLIQFTQQSNGGLALTLNRLIASAQGSYIRLCASDDLLLAGSTAFLLDFFIVHPKLHCVVGNGQVIDENGALIHKDLIAYHKGKPDRLLIRSHLVKELTQRWCLAGPCLLVKREHYQTMSYDESAKIDDIDLFLSLLKIPESIMFINKPVCQYRIHTTNTSKTRDTQKRVANLCSFVSTVEHYLADPSLHIFLYPLKYKSLAKIQYLQKQPLRCFMSLCKYFVHKIKMELFA